MQDTVALIGQGVTEESDPFFIFLFPAFTRKWDTLISLYIHFHVLYITRV